MNAFFMRALSGLLKISTFFHFSKHRFRNQPWYLISGCEKSGAKQLILNSGLCVLKPEYYGTEAVQLVQKFNVFDWYLTQEAVLIDLCESDLKSLDVLEQDFINYLRKRRHQRPINGMIFTLSITDLMLATPEQDRTRLQKWLNQLTHLYYTLKTVFPVYLIVTKTDLVNGFCEFFRNLNTEASQQVFGITCPLLQSEQGHVIDRFMNTAYDQLIADLQQRAIWTLEVENQQHSKNALYTFVQQMQLLKKPIMHLVSALFSLLPHENIIQLRGVYFTSAEQKGEPCNFFLHEMERAYDLKLPHPKLQEPRQDSYFIKKIFYEIIFSEGRFLGYCCSAIRYRALRYILFWIIPPLFLITSIVLYHLSYKINNQTSHAVIQAAHDYHQTHNKLALLQTVQHSEFAYQQASWIKDILYGTSFLHAAMIALAEVQAAHKKAPINAMTRSSKQWPRQNHVLRSHLKTIQTRYVNKNHQMPLSFFMKPLILDNQASDATLTVDKTVLHYAHGPEEPVYIRWSFAKTAQTKLVITDFQGHHSVFSSNGPWSLFYLIERSHLHKANDGRGYIFTPQVGTHTIAFKILADAPISAFELSSLKGFTVPRALGGSA